MNPTSEPHPPILLALFLAILLPGLAAGQAGELADAWEYLLSPGKTSDCLIESLVPPASRIEGRVVDTEGRPVVGVEIFVDPTPDSRRRDGEGRPRLPVATVTDEEGWFGIAGVRAGVELGLEVWHRRYAPLTAIRIRPPREGLEIEVRRLHDLQGRVVSESGEPIAGAGLLAMPENRIQASGFALGASAKETFTNEEGEFYFERLTTSKLYGLAVVAEGYTWHEERSVRTGSEVEIVLRSGGTLRGVVLDPEGEPLSNVEVNVLWPDQADWTLKDLILRRVTEADGRFEIPNLAPGPRMVEAVYHRFGRLVQEVKVVTDREGAEGPGLTLQFENSMMRRVTGQLIREDRSPLAGLPVRLVELDGGRSHEAETDEQGRFAFDSVPDGRYIARVEAEGLVLARPEDELVVAGSAVEAWTLVMRPGAILRGRLSGVDAEVLARVRVVASGPGTLGGRVEADSGIYTVEGLASGRWKVVATAPDGRRASGASILEEGDRETRLDLEFGSAVKVEGEVLRQGRPLAGALVRVGFRGARTDADGLFEISGVEPGAMSVQVFTDGRASGGSGQRLVHAESAEIEADAFLRIEIGEKRFEGEVVDGSTGEAVARARVALYDPERWRSLQAALTHAYSPTFQTTTDRSGRFELDPVPAGSYRVVVSAEGFSRVEEAVSVGGPGEGETPLRVELPPGDALRLEVRTAFDTVPRYLVVTVFGNEGATYSREVFTTRIGGAVRVEGVPRGRWNVRVQTDSGGLVGSAYDVEMPGPPSTVVLVPGGRLRIRASSLEGDPHAVSFTLADELGRPWPVVSPSFEFGEILLPTLPPGAWTARVRSQDGREWSGTARVESGREAVLLLE